MTDMETRFNQIELCLDRELGFKKASDGKIQIEFEDIRDEVKQIQDRVDTLKDSMTNLRYEMEVFKDTVLDLKEETHGNNHKDGLVIEVDRLKQSRLIVKGILWTLLTSILGILATIISSYFIG